MKRVDKILYNLGKRFDYFEKMDLLTILHIGSLEILLNVPISMGGKIGWYWTWGWKHFNNIWNPDGKSWNLGPIAIFWCPQRKTDYK